MGVIDLSMAAVNAAYDEIFDVEASQPLFSRSQMMSTKPVRSTSSCPYIFLRMVYIFVAIKRMQFERDSIAINDDTYGKSVYGTLS